MKHILYIAPHSFPIKSSESISNSKVAYVLAKAGYQVDCFTLDEGGDYPVDESINSILSSPSNLHVINVCPSNKLKSKHSFYDIVKYIIKQIPSMIKTGYVSLGIGISYDIVKAIKSRILETGGMKYDVMITRGFYTEYAGIYMSKKYGLKWIANWNDPYPVKKFPAPYGQGYNAKLSFFENKLYRDIQKFATVHTFPNPRLRDYMLKCFSLVDKKATAVVPHMAITAFSQGGKKKDPHIFTVVHCGTVSAPRNPLQFLTALSNLKKKGILDSYVFQVKCYFIGRFDSTMSDLIDDLDLNDVVESIESKPYSECQDFMANSDVSLIIEAICEEGIYLPTKFVDSLQVNLPVFCVSPKNGMLHDYVSEYKCGYFCDNESVDSIEKQLVVMLEDYSNNSMPIVDEERQAYFFSDSILAQYDILFNRLQ